MSVKLTENVNNKKYIYNCFMINLAYLSVILTKIKDNKNVALYLGFGLLQYCFVVVGFFFFLLFFFCGENKIREKILRSQDSGIRQAWDESLLTPMLYYGLNTINTYS